MQYYKRCIIICFALLAGQDCFSQSQPADMTGLWTGLMFNDTTELNYRYEIAISEKNGKLTGYSQTFFNFDGQEYYGVKKIKITIDGNKVITQDVKLIENNYPVKPPKGIYVLNVLNFELKNDVMMLSGMFQTNRTKEYAPATGYVHVEKKIDHKESPLVKMLDKLGLTGDLSFVTPEKPTAEIFAKAEVKEQPVAITKTDEKQKPAETEKPADPAPVKTEPAKEPPVVKVKAAPEKPADTKAVKPDPVKSQPVVKAKPAEIKKPAEEKAVITKTTQKEPAKAQEIIKTSEPVEVKETIVKKEPEPKKTTTPANKQPAAEIRGRIIETIQSVSYSSDSLMLTLYDNGEVDGDTVSVLMNGNVIMPRVGLSTNPVRKTIYTKDITDSIQIVMYAENLGTLAPNTGLLVVYDGRDRYEIRFSGDLQKNAAIVFRRKEK